MNLYERTREDWGQEAANVLCYLGRTDFNDGAEAVGELAALHQMGEIPDDIESAVNGIITYWIHSTK